MTDVAEVYSHKFCTTKEKIQMFLILYTVDCIQIVTVDVFTNTQPTIRVASQHSSAVGFNKQKKKYLVFLGVLLHKSNQISNQFLRSVKILFETFKVRSLDFRLFEDQQKP